MAKPSILSTKKSSNTDYGKNENLSPEQRHQYIAEAAYFIAEKNGFSTDSVTAWLEAERQINKQFGK